MHIELLHLLLLILVANGSPVLIRFVLRNRFSYPIDFGYKFASGKPLLGNSKTWRGLFGSIIITSLIALALGYDYSSGLLVAVGAMAGDILSSFIKRRLGMQSSAMAPLLDQLPESLFPALLVKQTFMLDYLDIFILFLLFLVLELGLSRLLYEIGIRRRPY